MSDINLTRHMNHLIEAKDIREENEQLKQALAKCREENAKLQGYLDQLILTEWQMNYTDWLEIMQFEDEQAKAEGGDE